MAEPTTKASAPKKPRAANGTKKSTATTAKLQRIDKQIARRSAALDKLIVKREQMAAELRELAQAMLNATNLPPAVNAQG